MKKFCTLILLFSFWFSFAQENVIEGNSATIDANYFYGNIANHNSNALIFIFDHPEGMVLSWNKKTFGEESWQQRYNYPDVGYSLVYQTFKNDVLGKSYSLLKHYNFYFLNRNLMLRIGQGLAYVTEPYDPESNRRNVAYASHLLSSTLLMLNYKKENLFNAGVGLQTGIVFTHNSNANISAPNAGINVISANVGLIYSLDAEKKEFIQTEKNDAQYNSRIGYNLALSSGINQSDVIGSGQYVFYIPNFFIDKRLGELSSVQLGTEVFFSKFLKEEIRYNAVAFPEKEVDPNTDYRRIGVYAGHELFIDDFSVISQLGYYVYYPYEFEKRIYFRIGLKKSFAKHFFGSVSLKSHAAKAEALEFGIGMRLCGNLKSENND